MKKLLLGLAAVLTAGILLGYIIGWLLQQTQEETSQVPIVIEEALPSRVVTLYFAEPQGRYLVRTPYQISGCNDDRDCMKNLLLGLIEGPKTDTVAVLPSATQVLGIELENDLVRVNFSRHLVDLHPGGSLSELLTIHSLINSLSESFPYVRQLQILIESEARESLKGHVRIDRPVYADYALTQPPMTGLETDAVSQRPVNGELEIDRIIREAAEMRDEP